MTEENTSTNPTDHVDRSQARQWITSQIGARQNYALPATFYGFGRLRRLYTDFYSPRIVRTFAPRLPGPAKALGGRFNAELHGAVVKSYNGRAVWNHVRAPRRDKTALYQHFVREGEWFARAVARDLGALELRPGVDHFLGYTSGALETIELLRSRGITTVIDQIDPGRLEQELVREEQARWPGWENALAQVPSEYNDRVEKEWAAADVVLVNSSWSKMALEAQGVEPQKIVIAPLMFRPPASDVMPRRRRQSQLSVLWFGTVNLRKGIPYLIEAARLLATENVRFVVAGPIEISESARSMAPPNVSFVGRIHRIDAARWYQGADVFVLPTISDGFAITQLEAMSHGLPVIVTPNCGQVVTDGVDGRIVGARDARALAEAILSLHLDRELLDRMSQNALLKAGDFAPPREARDLESALTSRGL